MKKLEVMKYGSVGHLKGFDLWARLKCFFFRLLFEREHYFMSADPDVFIPFCGRCGKLDYDNML